MEQIVEKNIKRIMENHPELAYDEARVVAECLYSLAKLAFDDFKISSNNPLPLDNQARDRTIISKGVAE